MRYFLETFTLKNFKIEAAQLEDILIRKVFKCKSQLYFILLKSISPT